MPKKLMILVALLLLLLPLALCFPESDNPIVGAPPLNRPNSPSPCTVQIVDNFACSSYGLIYTAEFTIPTACPDPWSMIVLDVEASQNGTQFDRVGALWIDSTEVLRTTTPEPTSDGITWTIEKDLTLYSSLFSESNTHVATLSIPNNVDSTYTGIPLINAYLTFYMPDDKTFPAQDKTPEIVELPSSSGVPGDWSAIALHGGQNFSYPFSLDSSDVIAASVSIMASAHACEEFWYSNLVNDEVASKIGACGGGSYREIQVYIDGLLAGAQYPFPVIYTGGVNPFLWRPLTGIMSFDIPAYTFDLTPFVGYLSDGKAHQLTVTIEGDAGDTEGGVWYVDSTLMLYHDQDLSPVSGTVSVSDPGSSYESGTDHGLGIYTETTKGSHDFSINAVINFGGSSPSSLSMSVKGLLDSDNQNVFTDAFELDDTTGNMKSNLETIVINQTDGTQTKANRIMNYPYEIDNYYAQNATTFELQATVLYSYEREIVVESTPSGSSFSIAWSNSMASNATYNRSLDHTVVYEGSCRS